MAGRTRLVAVLPALKRALGWPGVGACLQGELFAARTAEARLLRDKEVAEMRSAALESELRNIEAEALRCAVRRGATRRVGDDAFMMLLRTMQ